MLPPEFAQRLRDGVRPGTGAIVAGEPLRPRDAEFDLLQSHDVPARPDSVRPGTNQAPHLARRDRNHFAGLIGPFSYAEDVSHPDGVAVSLALTVAGLFLLSPSMSPRRIARALPVASVAVLAGMAAGVLLDAKMPGVLAGIGIGLIIAGALATRR